ncbi:MAG: DUF2336 domain-containing protein [Alphaproteobacteria bacterium]|nr:DUF2336 domain-containing protein [Alphaproteobacteria bacterium]
MRLLDSSTKAAPLLVQLHDSHKMYQLAKDPTPEARTELASIMSDLLNIELSVAEHELITDVLMTLIAQAEINLRRAVAERLSVMDNVPLRMIVHLANDEITVADPVLRRSRVLHDMDLIYIVKAKGPEYWRSIAMRPCISNQLIDVLVDTKDMSTAIHLTENRNITLTEKAIESFTEISKVSHRMAKLFVARPEVTEELAMKLYNFVADDLKQYITHNFDLKNAAIAEQKISDVVEDFRTSMQGDFMPTNQMVLFAEELYRRGGLNAEVLVENLRRGQLNDFIAMLCVFVGLPVATVVEILQQTSGQGLAVVCKAKHLSKHDFVNMYLLTTRLRSGRIVTQDVLRKALSYYDKIKTSDAREILNQSRH